MTREEELHRAHLGRQVLDNELWQEALTTVTEDIHKAWAEAPDTDTREACWHRLQAIEAIKAHLHQVLQTGRMASMSLEAEHARAANRRT